jgi:hypothetical protein
MGCWVSRTAASNSIDSSAGHSAQKSTGTSHTMPQSTLQHLRSVVSFSSRKSAVLPSKASSSAAAAASSSAANRASSSKSVTESVEQSSSISSSSDGDKLCCDKCDGRHATDSCPYYKKKRDDHPDGNTHSHPPTGSRTCSCLTSNPFFCSLAARWSEAERHGQRRR